MSAPVEIGLFVPLTVHADREMLAALGTGAEERGFDSIWAAEHLVLFDDYASDYPYASDGRIPLPPELGFLEPFSTLSFLAASTQRIRLGTGICLVPQRNPHLYGEGGRERRPAVGWTLRLRDRRRLARRGVPGRRCALRTPRCSLPGIHRSDEAALVRRRLGVHG